MTTTMQMTAPAGAATWRRHNAALLFGGIVGLLVLLPPARAADRSLGSATSPDGKVRVDIVSLQRTEGDTVTLRWQITNDGNDGYSMTPGNMHLVDLAGRRTYAPGLTSNLCNAPIGQRLVCYAVFGAPPATTRTMAVQFYEKLDLIPGVPISE